MEAGSSRYLVSMRIIFENNHSPATGRFKDSIVYDPLGGKFWLYDAWGTFIYLTTGMTGQSAYSLAVQLGFEGTEEEWVDSLTGAPGADGNTVLSGSGAPSSGLGANGDFYINTAAKTIYGPKTGGSWGSPSSLSGPQGATGSNGADGSKWFTASGVPSSGAGQVGDFYINSANGNYYEKTGASTWTLRGSLKGATGNPGILQSVVAGTNISINNTDPANPVISAVGGGGTPGGSDKQLQFNDDGSFGGTLLRYLRKYPNRTILEQPLGDPGQYVDIFRDDRGEGYEVGDVVTLDGGDGNAQLRVTQVNSEGGISDVEIISTGTGYVDDTYSVTGGSGSGAAFEYDTYIDIPSDFVLRLPPVPSSGVVQYVDEVVSGGSGYTVGDIVTLDGGNSDAQVRITKVDSGAIDNCKVIAGGSGYDHGAEYDVTGGSGSGGRLKIDTISSGHAPTLRMYSEEISLTYDSEQSDARGGSIRLESEKSGNDEVTSYASNISLPGGNVNGISDVDTVEIEAGGTYVETDDLGSYEELHGNGVRIASGQTELLADGAWVWGGVSQLEMRPGGYDGYNGNVKGGSIRLSAGGAESEEEGVFSEGGDIELEASDGGDRGGTLYLRSGYGSVANGDMIFHQGGGKYNFLNPDGNLAGILDLSNISSSNKTFSFPNTSGTVDITVSSKRFKKDIKPLGAGTLDLVSKLQPREFRYDEQHGDRDAYGLIAEEVLEIDPKLVRFGKDGQPDGVYYQELTAVLLKAVQDLTERVKQLEAKVNGQ